MHYRTLLGDCVEESNIDQQKFQLIEYFDPSLRDNSQHSERCVGTVVNNR